MPNDEHVAMLGRGAAAWNEWRAEQDETPDLSRAGLRGLDLSGFDLSRADLRDADLRGTKSCDADLSGAQLEGRELLQSGTRRRQSCRDLLDWSPISELRPACAHPEVAISFP
jgi:uncharacterized protein YjbI with pentapeptide repeats